MKNNILFCAFILTSGIINAQYVLDANNTGASLTDNGIMFNSSTTQPGYEIPKGSGIHTIFSSAMWFGGADVNGQLKMAVNDLYAGNQDVWPGPLSIGTADAITNGTWTQTMWTVSKDEIIYHLQNFQNAGYVTPADITNWPAHGDVSQNFDYYLAPFVDTDGNGDYNPSQGDYPCIKGDKATFLIMNDKANVHGSGADPIGLELHYMFYQYNQTGDIGNTTFMDVKMINRGTQTVHDFVVSLVIDGDLGNPDDDYFGCDSSRNLQYFYNDMIDEQGMTGLAYGANPPSFGVVCLSDAITSAISLNDNMGLLPVAPSARYNVMKGVRSNGAAVLTPGSVPTKFEYFDDPNGTLNNSQIALMTAPGNARTIMNVNVGTLTPNLEKEFTYAIVYNRSGNSNLNNVTGLFQTTDVVQSFFDNSTDGDCSQSILGVEEIQNSNFELLIVPNPSNGQFKLHVEGADDFELSITDMAGRKICTTSTYKSGQSINLNAPTGTYLVSVQTENGKQVKKLIVR